MEHVITLRFMLRMFGMYIQGYTYIYYDNEAVVNKSSVSSNAWNKKHNSARFHMVREVIASGAARVAHVSGTENPADLFTKILAKSKWFHFIQKLTENLVNRVKGSER